MYTSNEVDNDVGPGRGWRGLCSGVLGDTCEANACQLELIPDELGNGM